MNWGEYSSAVRRSLAEQVRPIAIDDCARTESWRRALGRMPGQRGEGRRFVFDRLVGSEIAAEIASGWNAGDRDGAFHSFHFEFRTAREDSAVTFVLVLGGTFLDGKFGYDD